MKTDREQLWEDAQEFEHTYHQHGNYRWREPLWVDQWDKVFGVFAELAHDSFSDSEILFDVGCGSRPCLDWFNGKATKFYSDPLLDKYVQIPKMKPYWEGKEQFMFSVPAEELVTGITDCDLVLCWNVLDHSCYWEKIVDNLHTYVADDGIVILGTDYGTRPSKGHPGIPGGSIALYRKIDELFSREKVVAPYHHRQVAMKLRKK